MSLVVKAAQHLFNRRRETLPPESLTLERVHALGGAELAEQHEEQPSPQRRPTMCCGEPRKQTPTDVAGLGSVVTSRRKLNVPATPGPLMRSDHVGAASPLPSRTVNDCSPRVLRSMVTAPTSSFEPHMS